MNILSIETSCDETAVSILDCKGGIGAPQFEVRGNALYSQTMEHEEYGGVFPDIAKREHAKNLVPLMRKACGESDLPNKNTKIPSQQWNTVEEILSRQPDIYDVLQGFFEKNDIPQIDAVAVTNGPGLEPALWIGLNFAKALSILLDVPLVPVNHLEAHLLTPLVDSDSLSFPAVGLIISGGHTQLILADDYFDYTLLGQTQDDAVGEAFDKVARMLDLGYPGGPEISRLAEDVRKNPDEYDTECDMTLPRPMIDSDDYNVSFSGLKTAVLYKIREIKESKNIDTLPDDITAIIAKEFEEAVTEVLLKKTKRALTKHSPASLILGGGVVANRYIRERFLPLADEANTQLLLPPTKLATDNAVMIGITGYMRYKNDDFITDGDEIESLEANGRLSIS